MIYHAVRATTEAEQVLSDTKEFISSCAFMAISEDIMPGSVSKSVLLNCDSIMARILAGCEASDPGIVYHGVKVPVECSDEMIEDMNDYMEIRGR